MRTAMTVVILALMPSWALAQSADEIFEATGIRRGLFVVASDDVRLALDLAKSAPVLVFVVCSPDKVEPLRKTLVEAKVYGRVTVAPARGGRIPLIDNVAAVAVADLDGSSGKLTGELHRVVRPLGAIRLKKEGTWETRHAARQKAVDDWPQYHHDAAMTDRSEDLLAGPAQGIQWLAGDNSIQPAKLGVRVVGARVVQVDDRGVIARDAHSGLPLWRRADLKPVNRYAFLLDESHVILIPRGIDRGAPLPSSMVALDLATGKDALVITEGVRLGWALAGITEKENKSLERKDRNRAKANREKATKSLDAAQARLADGVLLQTLYGEMVALEASTGKRLWSKTLRAKSKVIEPRRGTERMADHAWHHPLVLDGRVYAVEGETVPSWSYTHWPMGAVRAVHCLDLKTGKTHWSWTWPEALGEVAAAYNMTPVGDWMGLMLRTRTFAKGGPGMLFVKKDGSAHKHASDSPYGKSIGGGHSHARLLFVDGKVWVNGTTKPAGTVDLEDPGDRAKWGLQYAKRPRPVGCTVSRATPKYVFGSLTTYSLNKEEIRHTNAARSACDVGATPAAGMTFITPTGCFCAPYLPGFKAFHPRPFEGEESIDRLEKGSGEPAPRGNQPSDWPMYMANGRRSNWTRAKVADPLERAWVIEPEPKADDPLAAEWRDNWYTHGPVTAVSIAEGVAVYARTDRQEVVAIDPESGRERWSVAVDGRIDTAPTIHEGAIYAGTRNGWIYALNRDTGALVWRFFAAPRRDLIPAFGQLESRWPLHGSVTVQEDGVWVFAGRHNDTDAGIWWWRLDARSGEPKASGRLGSDGLSEEVGVSHRSDGKPSGANTPLVSDGRRMFLAGIYLEKDGDSLKDLRMNRGSGSQGEHAWWADNFGLDLLVPGNQGLVFDYDQMGGYKMPYYGFTQAAVYAYHGKDFLHAGGTTTEQHRGGGRGGRRAEVTRFRKLDAIIQVPHPKVKNRKMKLGSKPVWAAPYHESDGTGLGGLAVAANSVMVGFSVENRDHWRDRDTMPHRLRVFDYQTGQKRQEDLELPAKPVLHGVTVGAGRVFVTCEDGSIVSFGPTK